MKNLKKRWFVYMLRCADNTFYIGITTDLTRRIREHNSRRAGAKYTRGRQPVTLVYSEETVNRSLASKREHYLKKLSTSEKRLLLLSSAP